MTTAARLRTCLAAAALGLLAACGAREELPETPEPMGDFRLGYTVVVEENAELGPFTREAEPGLWRSELTQAIDRRLGRYEGDAYYHVAANVEMYVLALPGVPLLVSPKSALVLTVNVWDDATGTKINLEPKQITVFESFSGKTVIGSGLTQSREEQARNLAENAAAKIHEWMLENTAWFEAAERPAAEGGESGPGEVTLPPVFEVPAAPAN
ncbi:hypothetical protein ACQ5SP_00230 [Rhodovulum sp. YNF3179]|uniref:hypothetical protein n=1 Tax=Rhodovulum sp. YNF3179 TaxID=3425127 RepID=UPI003D350935